MKLFQIALLLICTTSSFAQDVSLLNEDRKKALRLVGTTSKKTLITKITFENMELNPESVQYIIDAPSQGIQEENPKAVAVVYVRMHGGNTYYLNPTNTWKRELE